MTQCNQNSFEFPRVHRRVVEARFDGGEITSHGGSLLLRQADRYLGLTEAVARALSDRRPRQVTLAFQREVSHRSPCLTNGL